MNLITRNEELADACARLATAPYVAVDTEFMREQTFWPKLCLVQIAASGIEVLIDSQALDLDLTPLFDLMVNEKVLKVFHSARQDIEIVHHLAGVIPHPIFDTQVAAMVCGFGEAVSYSMLVKRLLNRNLDKTSRFTDWSRRPLSERQLTYAIGDVTYLRDLYPKLKAQLDQSERASWLNEEMAVLTDPATYELHPEQAWKRLKMRIKTPKSLAVLMELAAWREREAQTQDVPRARILKDEALYDIASQTPRTQEDLGSLRTLHNGFARSMRGRAVLEAVGRGLERDPKTVPPIERGEPMPPEAQAVVDLLRVLLKARAGSHGVAPKADRNQRRARGDRPLRRHRRARAARLAQEAVRRRRARAEAGRACARDQGRRGDGSGARRTGFAALSFGGRAKEQGLATGSRGSRW